MFLAMFFYILVKTLRELHYVVALPFAHFDPLVLPVWSPKVQTEMQFRNHIHRWLRCVLHAAVEDAEGAVKTSGGANCLAVGQVPPKLVRDGSHPSTF